MKLRIKINPLFIVCLSIDHPFCLVRGSLMLSRAGMERLTDNEFQAQIQIFFDGGLTAIMSQITDTGTASDRDLFCRFKPPTFGWVFSRQGSIEKLMWIGPCRYNHISIVVSESEKIFLLIDVRQVPHTRSQKDRITLSHGSHHGFSQNSDLRLSIRMSRSRNVVFTLRQVAP